MNEPAANYPHRGQTPGSDPRAIAVTGASRGIGAAIALELARRGFRVGCLSRKGVGPEGADVPPELARRLFNFACDVTDEASTRTALAQFAVAAGGLHGLVNNAGIHLEGASDRLETSVFETVMKTNATAVFTTSREAYPHLVKSGGGIIVNIGSFYDKIGVKRSLAYCAAKAAVGAITRCLAVEWASKAISVVDVAPGYIETDLNREALTQGPLKDYLARRIPAGRHAGADAIARMVAAIFCENIAFLTGETIYVDGGQGIAH
ncbi:MAG: SDR family oxidoreductase [Betaproteobacteria bacterium]|nr:MAG: SDR family oxidoreductase [Betaproteobacteria bacterium]